MKDQAVDAPRPVVLIVEDDDAIRAVLTDVLAAASYCIEEAASSVEGLARIEAGGIDLILLDLLLPDMGGREFCRQVRAPPPPPTPHLPTLLPTELPPVADHRH